MLERAGFIARIGTEHLFVSVHDAVIHAVGIHSEVSVIFSPGIWHAHSRKNVQFSRSVL